MGGRLQRRQTARQQFRLGWPLGRNGLARQRRASLASARRNDPQEITLGRAEHEVHKLDGSQQIPAPRISRRVDPLAAGRDYSFAMAAFPGKALLLKPPTI